MFERLHVFGLALESSGAMFERLARLVLSANVVK